MSRRLPALESLRVLEAAARHGNFTRAARELGVTPAAVSLRIRDLEAELGVDLFHRNGPHLVSTEACLVLAGRLAEAMASIAEAVDETLQLANTIRLVTAPTFAARWLAPRLAGYSAKNAGSIRVRASVMIEADGEFDIAVRSGQGPWPNLCSIAQIPMRIAPMMSPKLIYQQQLTPADLLELPLFPDPHWGQWFRENGVSEPDVKFTTVDYPTQDLAAEAVIAGGGVALLAPDLFGAFVSDGRLVQPFAQATTKLDAWHLLRRTDERRAAVLRLCDWLQNQFEESAQHSGGA